MWQIRKVEKRSYKLLDEAGRELGRLENRSPWSFDARIYFEGHLYELRSLKWYSQTLSALVNGLPVAQCSIKDWSGKTMEIQEPVGTPVVRVEQPSVFKREYRLLDMDGQELAVLGTRIAWTSTYPNFEILRMGATPPTPFQLLFAVFAITVRNRRRAAAA